VRAALSFLESYAGKACLDMIANPEDRLSLFVALNRKKSGELFVCEVTMLARRHPSSGWLYTIGFQRDISAEVSVERLLTTAAAAACALEQGPHANLVGARMKAAAARYEQIKEGTTTSSYLHEKAAEMWKVSMMQMFSQQPDVQVESTKDEADAADFMSGDAESSFGMRSSASGSTTSSARSSDSTASGSNSKKRVKDTTKDVAKDSEKAIAKAIAKDIGKGNGGRTGSGGASTCTTRTNTSQAISNGTLTSIPESHAVDMGVQGRQGEAIADGQVEKPQQTSCLQGQLHKTKFCVYHLQGTCKYGDQCTFAHTCEEMKHAPDLSKTRLCKAFVAGNCEDPDCAFAHSSKDLRMTGSFYKKTLCIWYAKGKCQHGKRCRFAHGTSELRRTETEVDEPQSMIPAGNTLGRPGTDVSGGRGGSSRARGSRGGASRGKGGKGGTGQPAAQPKPDGGNFDDVLAARARAAYNSSALEPMFVQPQSSSVQAPDAFTAPLVAGPGNVALAAVAAGFGGLFSQRRATILHEELVNILAAELSRSRQDGTPAPARSAAFGRGTGLSGAPTQSTACPTRGEPEDVMKADINQIMEHISQFSAQFSRAEQQLYSQQAQVGAVAPSQPFVTYAPSAGESRLSAAAREWPVAVGALPSESGTSTSRQRGSLWPEPFR